MVGLLLFPCATRLNAWLWTTWLSPAAESAALQTLSDQNRRTRVAISATAAVEPLAASLRDSLVRWGFEVEETDMRPAEQLDARAAQREQRPAGNLSSPKVRVLFAPGAETSAEAVARRVRYLYFGDAAAVTVEQATGPGAVMADGVSVNVEMRAPPRVFRDRFRRAAVEPEMVVVPGGRFRMGDLSGTGDSDERPVREVRVSGFAIGRCEVTLEEYDVFAEATQREKPGDAGWGRGRRPVINVSWDDAVAYAAWLSEQTGRRYRLPTEAEREYAARAGSGGVGKVAGFSLHAGVAARADQRHKLERLCRCISRPAISEQRLSLPPNGNVRYQLKTPYRDGTTHVIFEPLDFIARLAALVPKPRVDLTRFHGVFAPNSNYRARVTPARRGRGSQHTGGGLIEKRRRRQPNAARR
jgi:hypothetical protein